MLSMGLHFASESTHGPEDPCIGRSRFPGGQRRLGEKEYRAPSVTQRVALHPRTQGGQNPIACYDGFGRIQTSRNRPRTAGIRATTVVLQPENRVYRPERKGLFATRPHKPRRGSKSMHKLLDLSKGRLVGGSKKAVCIKAFNDLLGFGRERVRVVEIER